MQAARQAFPGAAQAAEVRPLPMRGHPFELRLCSSMHSACQSWCMLHVSLRCSNAVLHLHLTPSLVPEKAQQPAPVCTLRVFVAGQASVAQAW